VTGRAARVRSDAGYLRLCSGLAQDLMDASPPATLRLGPAPG